MINKKLTITLTLVLVLVFSSACQDTTKINKLDYLSRTEFLMDTVMTVRIYDKQEEKILDKAFERLEEIESIMSLTIETSDINLINNNAGIKPVKVNADTYEVIKRAQHYSDISKGSYDTTIGELVDLWDVKAEEKEREFIPSPEEIKKAQDLVNYKELELLDDNMIYLKKQGMKVALGSIAKGYAADEVKRILVENGVERAIIDLGGNLYIVGEKAKDTKWKIGIQDPFMPTGSYAGILEVSDISVVTSGDYERYFYHQGKKYNHIIDPETGYPADKDLTGISIISDKSIDCDALATTVFVMGLDEGMEFVNTLDYIEAIFITKDKSVYITEGLKDIFSIGNPDFSLKEYK